MVMTRNAFVTDDHRLKQNRNMSATGILICHVNSYPFHERTLSLEHPVKIGRSVARVKAANDNAIFDCKVLSRNHALLWYESGKFFLKDTKSSNGTFVNNKRLSPSGEESIACEICSGDIVQFGVDVVESTKKVTHGCIVATLKLYLPDGKEAKALFSNSIAYVNITLEDLYKLNQCIQEAGRRENALRSKLDYMQQLLEQTRIATNQGWKALVLEDCLLSRLEMLESQVLVYSKNFNEDKLKMEMLCLLEDKVQYQTATKEILQKKVQEKHDIVSKIQLLKCRLCQCQDESQSLQAVLRKNQSELQDLAIKHTKTQQVLQETTNKLSEAENKLKEMIQKRHNENEDKLNEIKKYKYSDHNLIMNYNDSKLDSVNIHKQMSALKNFIKTLQDTNNEFFINQESLIEFINRILSHWDSIYLNILNNDFHKNQNDDHSLVSLNDIENDHTTAMFCSKNDIINTCTKNYIGECAPTSQKIFFISDKYTNLKQLRQYYIKKSMSLHSRFSFDPTTDIKSLNFKCNNTSDCIQFLLKFPSIKHNLKKKICKDLFTSLEFQSSNMSNQQNKLCKKIEEKEIKNLLTGQATKLKQIADKINDNVNKGSSEDFCINQLIEKCISLSELPCSNDVKFHSDDNPKSLKDWLLLNSIEKNSKNNIKHDINLWKIQLQAKYLKELSEQLVMMKEKYNMSLSEKLIISKKYLSLEAKCKSISYKSHVISIYYVLPLVLALIWMLIEKLL
ncbi:hypothetical protein TKK_0017158 [Trichogramma kaykai]|uniref:Sarcolemmal membrane-associated protein n=1 Tax=Trichogramma kaykai TaxID=54128 RepID=A0ABD2W5A6_9HYME